jgi:hypothetical protein
MPADTKSYNKDEHDRLFAQLPADTNTVTQPSAGHDRARFTWEISHY